jgi:DNA-binding FadR family transcriptional regulator
MADYAPVERSTVPEQVAKRLFDMVRSRNLKPGDQLPPERELAAMLQVSRPSVREALRGLQILGMLKARQGGGVYVASLDAGDLLAPLTFLIALNPSNVGALHEARVLVDGGIAAHAAERIGAEDLLRLERMLPVQRELLHDALGFRVSDLEFHTTVAEATGNPFLARVSHALYVLGVEYRRVASETEGVLARSLADHAAIVAALRAHDAPAARTAMVAHLGNVHRSTVEAMAHSAER